MRVLAGTVLTVLALGLAAAPASAQDEASPVEGAEEASQETGGPDGTDAGPGGPHEVQVGALINDIQQLDLQTQVLRRRHLPLVQVGGPGDRSLADASSSSTRSSSGATSASTRGSSPRCSPDGTLYSIAPHPGPVQLRAARSSDYPFDDPGPDRRDRGQERRTSPSSSTCPTSRPDRGLRRTSRSRAGTSATPLMEVVSNQYPTNFGEPRGRRGHLLARDLRPRR